MLRHDAARVLGVSQNASQTDARAAYLSLLQQASDSRLADPAAFESRSSELQSAYESFSAPDASPSVQHSSDATYSSNGTEKDGSKRKWAVVILAASLGFVFFVWTTLDGSPEQNTQSTAATELDEESVGNGNETESEPSVSRDLDEGKSGFLNSCWKDEEGLLTETGEESVRVVPTPCSSSQAQWLVYEETRIESNCDDDFITLEDGWILCIRAI